MPGLVLNGLTGLSNHPRIATHAQPRSIPLLITSLQRTNQGTGVLGGFQNSVLHADDGVSERPKLHRWMRDRLNWLSPVICMQSAQCNLQIQLDWYLHSTHWMTQIPACRRALRFMPESPRGKTRRGEYKYGTLVFVQQGGLTHRLTSPISYIRVGLSYRTNISVLELWEAGTRRDVGKIVGLSGTKGCPESQFWGPCTVPHKANLRTRYKGCDIRTLLRMLHMFCV